MTRSSHSPLSGARRNATSPPHVRQPAHPPPPLEPPIHHDSHPLLPDPAADRLLQRAMPRGRGCAPPGRAGRSRAPRAPGADTAAPSPPARRALLLVRHCRPRRPPPPARRPAPSNGVGEAASGRQCRAHSGHRQRCRDDHTGPDTVPTRHAGHERAGRTRGDRTLRRLRFPCQCEGAPLDLPPPPLTRPSRRVEGERIGGQAGRVC